MKSVLLQKLSLYDFKLDDIFYKASQITNVAYLKENPRDIDRYAQEK